MTVPRDELYPTVGAFSPPSDCDELLHPPSDQDDPALSETSFFGFNIPDAQIDCEIYHWFHPNLRVMSGGLMLFKGMKKFTAAADYLDYRTYLPYPSGDLDDVHYPTGVQIRIIEPLRKFHIRFESPDSRVAFDFLCTAVMPAAGRADRTHFVQAMRCEGELHLDGERHLIDGFTTRDRSYNLPRSETPHAAEPLTWGAAVFSADLAYHFVGGDHAELSAASLRWGYVWRHGRLLELVRMRKQTKRDAHGSFQTEAEIELEDAEGVIHRLLGRTLAGMPMPFWPNMVTNLALMEYRLPDGRVGHGDYQDVQFGHFLRKVQATEGDLA